MVSLFGAGVLPAFSFTYGGKRSEQFIKEYNLGQKSRRIDNVRTEHIYTYEDPKTRLQVRCECISFKDFPAVEWVVKFKNNGEEDTPILEDVHALDIVSKKKGKGDFVLHRAHGSSATKMDFAPIDELINHVTYLAPVGGRSSNTTIFPFFNIEATGEGGIIVGIGWSGQWAATLAKDDSSSLRVRAGMELTHLKLHPGEEIRTPRILLLFWQGGDYIEAHNMLRRFILKHHTLMRGGKPATVPLACMDRRHGGEESNKATEQSQIEFGTRYAKCGVEYLWIDAGWFEGLWPSGVGNWFVRQDGFPNGLRPVSDAVKKVGMGLVIWFEPERVHHGTWLDKEHPDWILRLPGSPNGLLDLGNPEALHWLIEHISGMIQKEGINVYRQDFNIDPLSYWRAADSADRQGMTEIRHIEGLYAFWDELLARNQGLIIDNCASGGRRIDLETISRSVALWRTDYQYGEPNGQQSHTYGVNFYLPTTSTGCLYPNTYSFRSAMNAGLCLCPAYDWSDADLEQVCHLIEEFKRVRHLFYGDFYPLTPHSVTDDTWIAYQFNIEDLHQGMILAFRRPKCPVPKAILKLRGLSPDARYEVHFEDTGVKEIFTGKNLARGIDVTIESTPGSALITYRQIISRADITTTRGVPSRS